MAARWACNLRVGRKVLSTEKAVLGWRWGRNIAGDPSQVEPSRAGGASRRGPRDVPARSGLPRPATAEGHPLAQLAFLPAATGDRSRPVLAEAPAKPYGTAANRA